MTVIRKTNSDSKLDIDPTWMNLLEREFQSPYMLELQFFLKKELEQGKKIFPQTSEYFAALKATPIDDVKVVILGQDPYHNLGQAHGLSFSVRPGTPIPRSLQNIYKELQQDIYSFNPPKHGFLKHWADQGVLLLNSVLSVEENKPASHKNKGWERFTDKVIQVLNDSEQKKVFFLWGNYAQQKGSIINRQKHLVLESAHPSPLSASRGFFGCKHFSKANEFLIANRIHPIHWELPNYV